MLGDLRSANRRREADLRRETRARREERESAQRANTREWQPVSGLVIGYADALGNVSDFITSTHRIPVVQSQRGCK